MSNELVDPRPKPTAIYKMARNIRLSNPDALMWIALNAWAKAYDRSQLSPMWIQSFTAGWQSVGTAKTPLELRIERLKDEIEQTRDTLNLMLGELGELEDRAAGIKESEPQPYTEWTNDGVKGTGRTYGKERLG